MYFKTLMSIFAIIFLMCFVVLKTADFFPSTELTSPVLGISSDQISLNAWAPKSLPDLEHQFKDAPEISAISAFFVETDTGEVLYTKNPDQKLSIASLTKLMTTIIALENKNFNDTYLVSTRASEVEPDEMVLLPGEKLTLRNLLDGIFLVSANDAAEVIAEGTINSKGRFESEEERQSVARSQFINLMNLKSSQLGMNNTYFVNPTGLEEDPEDCEGRSPCQYSTSTDVAIMSRFLIKKWPNIIDISSQPYVFIEKTPNHQDYEMYTGINLLTSYPGVVGLKTGYTPEAGLTLVTLARNNGKEVLGVLLGSVNRRDDAKELLDYSFRKLEI